MARIISMSLDEKLLEELDGIQKSVGFRGRSEVIRSGIKLLVDDLREKERLKGHAECVLVIMHDKRHEDAFIKAKHKYENIIGTQVHSNLCNDKCLELFVLHGPADRINGFLSDIRRNRHVEFVKLVVP